jgi:hypothetical protein
MAQGWGESRSSSPAGDSRILASSMGSPPRSSAKGGDVRQTLDERSGDAALASLAVPGIACSGGRHDVGLLATTVTTSRLRRISAAASPADALPASDPPCDRNPPGYPVDRPGGQELRRQHLDDRRHGATGPGRTGRATGPGRTAGTGRAAGTAGTRRAGGVGRVAGAHHDPAVHALIGPVLAGLNSLARSWPEPAVVSMVDRPGRAVAPVELAQI